MQLLLNAETGEVPGRAIFDRIHFSDYLTHQELRRAGSIP
jgi:hypothetical protein